MAEHREVRGQLLERDSALAERRHGDEVEAAAAGLAGERRGQREDRPQRCPEGEDRPVLPAHVAAQRAELLGLPEQVDHRRRDAPDELVDLEPGRRRRKDARDGGAQDERHPAEEAGGDDEREPRIADGLAIDAPEAVQAAAERDGPEGGRAGRQTGLGGHDAVPAGVAGSTGAPPSGPYWARNVSSRLGSRLLNSRSS